MDSHVRHYRLTGEPTVLVKIKSEETFKGWDSQRHARTMATITLASQHGDIPLFAGPIALEITFFFKKPMKPREGWRMWHQNEPNILHLLSFVQDACRGTVYEKHCAISAISMKKLYDAEPHTDIYIHELRKDDSNKI
jgi:Holliday junction resolvase RusA-like endonuclease